MNRIFIYALPILIIVAGCSGTTEQLVEEPSGQEDETFPGWFHHSTEISRDSVSFYSYATAIDSDSSRVLAKAENQAKAEFVAGLSELMEDIRNAAVNEEGQIPALADRSFILALRNAEADMEQQLTVLNRDVEREDPYNRYRGFVELSVSREKLIAALDASLSAHSESWQAMKSSTAFSDF